MCETCSNKPNQVKHYTTTKKRNLYQGYEKQYFPRPANTTNNNYNTENEIITFFRKIDASKVGFRIPNNEELKVIITAIE